MSEKKKVMIVGHDEQVSREMAKKINELLQKHAEPIVVKDIGTEDEARGTGRMKMEVSLPVIWNGEAG